MTTRMPKMDHLPEKVGVLVVGGGLAGCAATLAAAEAGAYSVMVEKEVEIGGSTVLSAGLAAFAGTEEQSSQGISDSIELLRQDLLETGQFRSDIALVDLYCAQQLETYKWLKSHGVEYGEIHAASGQTVPRSHPTNSTLLLRRLLHAAGQLGARVVTETTARRLVRHEGVVVGLEVERAGKCRQIFADAVVLASGGFSQNAELISRFAPQMSLALRAGGAGCTGDGLLMAWQLGAGIVDTPFIKGTYGIYPYPHPHEDGTGILPVYKGGIAVNSQGRRFVDESLPYKTIGDANLEQPNSMTYQIFDSKIMAHSTEEVPIYDFAGRNRAGMLAVGQTIRELADEIMVPPDALEREVGEYNRCTADGLSDHLGRVHLSGGVGERVAITEPPFYAHPSATVVLATYCGLTVDSAMQVVDVLGEPISGLYAAGEVVGGLHGGGYMTGSAIGKAAIFGRIAGQSASMLRPFDDTESGPTLQPD
jgi:fumarate reductase flavoprotein subunit